MLLGQPQRAREAVDRQIVGEAGDLIILMDDVALALVEGAGDEAEALVLRATRRGVPGSSS